MFSEFDANEFWVGVAAIDVVVVMIGVLIQGLEGVVFEGILDWRWGGGRW